MWNDSYGDLMDQTMNDNNDNNEGKILKSLFGMTGTVDILKNSDMGFGYTGMPKKHFDDIINGEQDDDYEDDFTASECKICGKEIKNLYSWYNLKPEHLEGDPVSVCSVECLRAFRDKFDLSDYEIIEHDRCSAYFECEEIGNLRRKCERTSNKSYQDVLAISLKNYCEPAQAGIILSTHKLREILENFSKQTEAQYQSNKKMVEKGERIHKAI